MLVLVPVTATAMVIVTVMVVLVLVVVVVEVVVIVLVSSCERVMGLHGRLRQCFGSRFDLVSYLVSIRLNHTQNGRDSTSCRGKDLPVTIYKHSLPTKHL